MPQNKKFPALVLIVCLSISACNLPGGQPAEGASIATFTPVPDEAVTITSTAAVAQECSPIVTANTDANVRSGPGQVYNKLGFIQQGGTAPVAGRNSNGTWWYIQFAAGSGGYAWIAESVTTAACIPDTLAVIAAPPTPAAVPSSTPAAGSPSSTPASGGATFIAPPVVNITPLVIDPSILTTPSPSAADVAFEVDYEITWFCNQAWRVSFILYNQGTVNLESVYYSVEAPAGTYLNAGTINNAAFEATAKETPPACAQPVGHGQSFLAPGQGRYVPINISGPAAGVTEGFLYIEACTQNNRSGVCESQVLYFFFTT